MGVPKSILPVFTGSGTGLREEFSGRSRDHGGLRCDVLSWAICEFSTDLLNGLNLCMYSTVLGYSVAPEPLEGFLHLSARLGVWPTKGERLIDVTFHATAEVSTGRRLLGKFGGTVLAIGTREVSQ